MLIKSFLLLCAKKNNKVKKMHFMKVEDSALLQ